ncbi:MAG: hypothetical protein ABIR11_02290 [Candidatus Limnocylindrales bacterium]
MLVIDGVPSRRRLGSAYAQAKLAEALFEIALDGIDPALAGPQAPAARAWLRVGLERPITRATEAALDRFCAELELMVRCAPPHLQGTLGILEPAEPAEPVATGRRKEQG